MRSPVCTQKRALRNTRGGFYLVQIYDLLGNLDKVAQDYEAALENYKMAIRSDPGYPFPYNSIGIIYGGQGRTKEAIPYFEKAVERNPSNYIFSKNLGSAYNLDGNKERAIYFWRQVPRNQPGPTRRKGTNPGRTACPGPADPAICLLSRSVSAPVLDPRMIELTFVKTVRIRLSKQPRCDKLCNSKVFTCYSNIPPGREAEQPTARCGVSILWTRPPPVPWLSVKHICTPGPSAESWINRRGSRASPMVIGRAAAEVPGGLHPIPQRTIPPITTNREQTSYSK